MKRRQIRKPASFNDAETGLVLVLRELEDASEYVSWICSLMEPHLGRRVLEIGAGRGTFTERLVERHEVVALEPSKTLAETIQLRFSNRVKVVTGTLENLRPAELFDAAIMINVLEHIEYDLAALETVRSQLRDGGRIVLWVPAFEMLYGRFDHLIGHFRRYRRGELERVCKAAGFAIIESRYVNFPGFFAWWLIVRLLGRTPTSGGLASIYDKVFVPIVRRLESRTRVPVGLSIFVVAEKFGET